MTVVVALKSADYLQPHGRHLQFEPGILVAGDTRISYVGAGNRPAADNHVKVDSIGDFGIAGYAGNRKIATSALTRLEEAVIQTGDFGPYSIGLLAQQLLVESDSREPHLQATLRRVQVLLGVRDPKTQRFVLYEMITDNGFDPQPRDGMAAI